MKDWNKIIAKHLAHECSDDEKSALAEWVKSDELNAKYLKKMKEIWESSEVDTEQFNPDVNAAWNKLNTETTKGDKTFSLPSRGDRKIWHLISRVAAVLVIGLGIVFFIYKLNVDTAPAGQMVVETHQNHTEKQIALPDGSKVWLGRNSKIRYPESFDGPSREVSLDGMAFFEVSHNPDKPFLIQAGETVTKVLGTSFNLRAYESDDLITVTVITGKVSLSNRKDEGSAVILAKEEKGVFSKKTNGLSKGPNDDLNFMAWRTGKIQFKDAILEDAILQLNQHYGMNIALNTPTPQKCLLTATFDNQSLEEVLVVIETIFEATRENKDGTIVLTAKGC